MGHPIDFARLAKLVKSKRGERGLRDVAAEIGDISPSTLSRIEGERVSDMNVSTLTSLCDWLGIDPATLMAPAPSAPPPELDLADSIELQLRAAPDLDPETARLLAKMFKAAYREAKNQGDDESGA